MNVTVILASLSFAANVVLALIVYSFKATIKVAILEAVANITRDYATKEDVREVEARLREQIGLRDEFRDGLSRFRTRSGDM